MPATSNRRAILLIGMLAAASCPAFSSHAFAQDEFEDELESEREDDDASRDEDDEDRDEDDEDRDEDRDEDDEDRDEDDEDREEDDEDREEDDEDREEDDEDYEDRETDDEPGARFLGDRRESSGLGFELALGPSAVFRRMNLSGSAAVIEHAPGLYLGGVLRLRLALARWPKLGLGVIADAEGGFGSAKDSEVEPALGRQLVTEHTFALGRLLFEQPIGAQTELLLGAGMAVTSFTIEPNPDYTGHRYVNIAASAGARRWLSDTLRVTGELILLPGLSTNQSANADGPGQSFGARIEARFVWRFYQPLEGDLSGAAEAAVRYRGERFQTAFPAASRVGDLTTSADTAHSGILAVSYHL